MAQQQKQAGTAGDVVDELARDHREALGSLARISCSTAPQERRNMKEMYVYPVMRDRLTGRLSN